jgi:hypothetical protein
LGEIEALARELLSRQMQVREAPDLTPIWALDRALIPAAPIGTEKAAMIGGLADAASTYSFLKRGTGQEENAMFGGAKNSPLKTALGVATGAAAGMGARALLRKMGFKRLADMLAGTQGAHQIGLAAQNAHYDSKGGFPAGSSSEKDVRTKVQTALTSSTSGSEFSFRGGLP